jgi:hypothetical protein
LPSQNIIGAAYHEAGHVVVALHYKLKIGNVWIQEDGGGGADPLCSDEHLALIDRFAVWLSGGMAQQHFNAWTDASASVSDYVRVINATPQMTEAERRPLLDEGKARALKIIEKNAAELKRLAEFLIKRHGVHIDEFQPPLKLQS